MLCSFIVFGCLAILGGLITFPFIHKANSPEEATFLTDREKAYVKACMAKDAGYSRTTGETTRLNFKEWKAVFVDWQTYSWTFQYVSHIEYCTVILMLTPSLTTNAVLLLHTTLLPGYLCSLDYHRSRLQGNPGTTIRYARSFDCNYGLMLTYLSYFKVFRPSLVLFRL